MKFRKKPVVIEAIQFRAGEIDDRIASEVRMTEVGTLEIDTLEGTMTAHPGDWIIRGVSGELYPCKPDIFDATYEQAGASDEINAFFAPKLVKRAKGLNYSQALACMKGGAACARAGWNGKGMWVAMTPGYSFAAKHAKCGHAAAIRAVELGDPEAEIHLLPHLDMRAADGSLVIGWLASQTDQLAEDWEVVEVS